MKLSQKVTLSNSISIGFLDGFFDQAGNGADISSSKAPENTITL